MRLELTEEQILAASRAAHEAGIKLEVVQGLPVWEFLPSPLHTIETKRIERSVRPAPENLECGCHAFQDMSIRFPDASLRRPDISIFCEVPQSTQESTTLVPRAVIEVISPGSEVKDLHISPSFYLGQGVLDVIVFDPQTSVVDHFRRDGRMGYRSPIDVNLECGCVVTV